MNIRSTTVVLVLSVVASTVACNSATPSDSAETNGALTTDSCPYDDATLDEEEAKDEDEAFGPEEPASPPQESVIVASGLTPLDEGGGGPAEDDTPPDWKKEIAKDIAVGIGCDIACRRAVDRSPPVRKALAACLKAARRIRSTLGKCAAIAACYATKEVAKQACITVCENQVKGALDK